MSEIERSISHLIKTQFPAFYREEGSLLVDFITAYYEWMETHGQVRIKNICEDSSSVAVVAGSPNIVGTDTNFTRHFSNGDYIALCKDAIVPEDYEVYRISEVVNNTHITLESDPLPDWSLTSTGYGATQERLNPLFLSRGYLDHQDIDRTLDDFVVWFKQKYLRGIRFDTLVNTRRLIKNSLDLYRSKGTERSVDLLMKMAFGRPATVYHPSRDLLKPSDGLWFVPRYLEVAPNEKTVDLVDHQIKGLSSGAEAFCDSVIRRRTSQGKIIDVLYISAIQGVFQTEERINTFDDALDTRECPVITGSLNAVDIAAQGSGSDFSVGDRVTISSNFGEAALARVTATQNNLGIIDFTMVNGGYGYTSNAEVLISEDVLRIVNVVTNNDTYFSELERIEQRSANINYVNLSGELEIGNELFSYHANGDQRGQGVILNLVQETSESGEMRVSVLSGNIEGDALFTAGNVDSLNLAVTNGYFDTTASANVIGRHANVQLEVSNVQGNFEIGEEVFQEDVFGSKIANGILSLLGDEAQVNSHQFGAFVPDFALRGVNSGATANIDSVAMMIGVVQIGNNPFISTSNNRVVGLGSSFEGEVNFTTEGAGANLVLSNTLLYEEEINLNSDFIRDYLDTPLTLEEFTGNVEITSGSSNVVGDGTSFTTELQLDLTGNLSVESGLDTVTGDGTSFTTEVVNNDFLEIDLGSSNVVRKVIEVSNDTHLTVNLAFDESNSEITTAEVRNYVRVAANDSYAEARYVISIANDTHLTVNSPFGFTNTETKLERSWGFLGLLEANSTYGTLEEILSFETLNVGKLSAIVLETEGSNYEASPIVRVNENRTRHLSLEEERILGVSNLSADFATGEVVTQEETSARGMITSKNTTHLIIQNLRISVDNSFVETTNSSTMIVGEDTATEANVDSVVLPEGSNIHGYNAVIETTLESSNGAVSAVQILDSGFGFIGGEEVTGVKASGITGSFTGFANNRTHGEGQGFYFERGGFLSSTKKLHDGVYWQDYSYEVRSSVTLERYRQMLREIVHVAGTALFGRFILDSEDVVEIEDEVSVKDELYEGWFPIHDYDSILYFYNGLKLFPTSDWNDQNPSYEFDLQDTPPQNVYEYPVGEDLDDDLNFYMGTRLIPMEDYETSNLPSVDVARPIELNHATRGPIDLEKDDVDNIYYDCETAGETLDLEDTLEHFQQKFINTTDINLENENVNIIYDCMLYDEQVDLQKTLTRI